MCICCCNIYGCCKKALCNDCGEFTKNTSICPICENSTNIQFECEFCKDSHPIEVFHLNFPYIDICDSCSLVVILCKECGNWATEDPCGNCA